VFDITFIGGGPAGTAGAIKAAAEGQKVAVVERGELGGTCLNRGCIPTKALLKSADIFADAKAAGFLSSEIFFEQAAYQKKDALILKLREGLSARLSKNKIICRTGEASFIDKNTLKIALSDGKIETIESNNFVIATGSRPAKLPISGIEHALTSDEVLKTPVDADKILIIGGGVIGAEFASYFNAGGKKVTIAEAEANILNTFDREVSQRMALIFKKRGITVLTAAKVRKIEKIEANRLSVEIETAGGIISEVFGAVVVSVGRVAEVKSLNLQSAGFSSDTALKADICGRTEVENVYAVGDAAAAVKLAHFAEAQAVNAVCDILDIPPAYDLAFIPSCVYTSPEIASVGRTNFAAGEAIIAKSVLGGNGRAQIQDAAEGFVKLAFEPASLKLLGATIMAPFASELIYGLAAAAVNGLTAKELAKTVYPHPSVSEAVREAAQAALEKSV